MYWTERYFETQYLAGLIICIAILAGVAIWGDRKTHHADCQ